MSTPAEIIRREIAEHGVLSFARFMELALYCPDFGYYEAKKDSPGRRGDFYTSVSAGELFGQLLAFQFAAWLDEVKALNPQLPGAAKRSEDGSTLSLIEAGAHDGRLAADILKWLQAHRPELSAQLEYGIIEPSLRRHEWQKETLEPFAPRVRWFTDLKALSHATRHPSLHGVIFSNELLDAMPVHRFGWDAGTRSGLNGASPLTAENLSGRVVPTPSPRAAGRRSGRGAPLKIPYHPSSIFHLRF